MLEAGILRPGFPFGKVAAQSKHVLNAAFQHGVKPHADVCTRGRNAGQVRKGSAVLFLNMARHAQGIVGSVAACAISDADEIRREAGSLLYNLVCAGKVGSGFWREQFTGKR